MATTRPFGISTYLFQSQRLSREHLLEIASHGFNVVELFASRTHFDYTNPSAIAGVQQWLGEAGLEVAGVHVPLGEDPEAALLVGRRIAFRSLVVQTPAAPKEAARLVERLAGLASPLGIAIAVDSTSMSPAGSLVHFVEEGIDAAGVVACLDFGRAHVDGDLVDAIETVSGHLGGAHVHDSRGRRDEHLVPFDGTIDWASAMLALQKVGYEGALVFDVFVHGSARETLEKIARARQKIEQLLEF